MPEVNPLRRLRTRQAIDDPTAVLDDPHAALLTAAGLGDEDAFGRLYDELAPLLHGIVLRVLRDPARSEEVTQEVFVELWRLAPRYDGTRGTVRSWATTIAHRRAVDRVRSEQSARDRDQRDTDLRVGDATPVDEIVGDRLERERVARALAQLTDLQRQAVELAYYGGHTYREVAVMLGVAEGTVKTRIRDGLIRLRDEMGVTT
jgi:RNA polymerase sigma-70 factor (ECF subfamily)